MQLISTIIVAMFAIGLISFELIALTARPKAVQLLEAFAKTPFHHFLEQALRLVIGASLVVVSPHMLLTNIFLVFGWVMLITSLALIGLPWHWHKKFAQKVIPPVIKFIHVYGTLSLTLGIFTLYCLITPHL